MNIQKVHTLESIVEKFINYASYRDTGSGTVAKMFHVDVELVKTARKIANAYREKLTNDGKRVNILLLDIETAPILVTIWRLWKQVVDTKQVLSDWYIMSYAAKWLYGDTMISSSLSGAELITQNDSRLLVELNYLLDSADIIITYNGSRFDLPKINTRFLLHNLTIPGKYQHIDLLKVVKENFSFSSNSLGYVCRQLGLSTKDESKYEWWQQAYFGDEEAMEKLQLYNNQDVIALEDLYMKLRPWVTNHPNLNLYAETIEHRCGVCGGSNLTPRGYSMTAVGKYPVHKCNDCGALLRERRSVLTRTENKILLKN